MYIEEIGRHLAVSSFSELEKSLKLDRGFWNVVSIREPNLRRPQFLTHARTVVEILCEDSETNDSNVSSRPPRSEDVAAIFEFVNKLPGEPILVHCLAGLSRSPAVALAIIVQGMIERNSDSIGSKSLVHHSAALLLQIRPQARPNVLFLRLCLESFMAKSEAEALSAALANHPALLQNRSKRS
jgi:predicted protein tyrosine phosphatase